ncbi:hypothetical protein P4O66_018714 [Electrophorus voltai]|uniref:Delta-like protein n=1 Tax=Electrophorus voltai TaxID=2609070 RepID=A0AAD8YSX0_9TELE|nr:hypothetical protein P4O66_018714 [Electrophorus voltai]
MHAAKMVSYGGSTESADVKSARSARAAVRGLKRGHHWTVLFLFSVALQSQVVRAVGSFELQIHQWQNSLGILQSGQCCDPQASRGQDCLLDDQCDTFFRACLKEYQARVAPTGTCTFGIGSTPVLGGNSHTVRHRAHEGGEGGRIIIPFDYAWPGFVFPLGSPRQIDLSVLSSTMDRFKLFHLLFLHGLKYLNNTRLRHRDPDIPERAKERERERKRERETERERETNPTENDKGEEGKGWEYPVSECDIIHSNLPSPVIQTSGLVHAVISEVREGLASSFPRSSLYPLLYLSPLHPSLLSFPASITCLALVVASRQYRGSRDCASPQLKSFSLVIEVLDHDNETSQPGQEELIARVLLSSMLNPGEQWQTYRYHGHQLSLEYRLRFRCHGNYYGPLCNQFCRARDDFFGHFNCDATGSKVCKDGWAGPECRQGEADSSSTHPGQYVSKDVIWPMVCAVFLENASVIMAGRGISVMNVRHFLVVIMAPALNPGNACVTPTGVACSVTKLAATHNALHNSEAFCATFWRAVLHSVCTVRSAPTVLLARGGARDLNYCGNHLPCKNGGTCINTEPNEYQCVCQEGFLGRNCDIAMLHCDSNPCGRGSTCRETSQGFQCLCAPGWTGRSCQIDMNECETGICVHAHSCRNLIGGYLCDCLPEWDGPNCDRRNGSCQGPCFNGGRCEDSQCICLPGFSGERCQTAVGPCDSTPCLHGGECLAQKGGVFCNCPRGYTGTYCEEVADLCNPNPCQKGVPCQSTEGGYMCACPEGYFGNECMSLKELCHGLHCQVSEPSGREFSLYMVLLGVLAVLLAGGFSACALLLSRQHRRRQRRTKQPTTEAAGINNQRHFCAFVHNVERGRAPPPTGQAMPTLWSEEIELTLPPSPALKPAHTAKLDICNREREKLNRFHYAADGQELEV